MADEATENTGRKLVGVSEYARLRGLNKSTISRQVAKGIIPNHNPGGDPLLDPEEADAARSGNLDRSKAHFSPLGLAGSPSARGNARMNYNTARTATEEFKAKQAEMDYNERIGNLVSRSAVETEAFTAARQVRDRLFASMRAVAGLLVGKEEREIAAALRTAVADALADLTGEFEGQAGNDVAVA